MDHDNGDRNITIAVFVILGSMFSYAIYNIDREQKETQKYDGTQNFLKWAQQKEIYIKEKSIECLPTTPNSAACTCVACATKDLTNCQIAKFACIHDRCSLASGR